MNTSITPNDDKKNPHRIGFAFLPFMTILLEFLLRVTSSQAIFHDGLPGALLTAVAVSLIGIFLAALPRSPRAGSWISFIWLEIITLCFVLEYFMINSYTVFMEPGMIVSEAGNVAGNFTGNVLNVLKFGFPMILLFHIPSIAYLLLRRFVRLSLEQSRRGRTLLSTFVLFLHL